MKEIKFRCWHKKKKAMFEVDSIHSLGPADQTLLWVVPWEYYQHDNAWNSEDIELMQFTGLHDKNGKGIWEGDIAKCGAWLMVCKWIYGAFRWECSDHWTDVIAAPNGNMAIVEIIGNIYSNPELMEKQ